MFIKELFIFSEWGSDNFSLIEISWNSVIGFVDGKKIKEEATRFVFVLLGLGISIII